MNVGALLVRVVAPAHLADSIIGDLYERQACPAEVLLSVAALSVHRASQSFEDNWAFALPVAAVICALCVVTIPFWDHLGMASGVFHVLRLFAIGLVLGCIPRASSLSFAFLLVLIGISDILLGSIRRNFTSA